MARTRKRPKERKAAARRRRRPGVREGKSPLKQTKQELQRKLAALEQDVETRTAQLRQLIFELSMTEDRERRAVALDLHDHLGQLLSVANVTRRGTGSRQ